MNHSDVLLSDAMSFFVASSRVVGIAEKYNSMTEIETMLVCFFGLVGRNSITGGRGKSK